ncbi:MULTISPECIES: hypothetical protein [Methylomonas]|uniref:Uncharacterized protein n=2 Tax=Methylomonas TaxID=416 RepID=A0A126T7J2_9GAMM|nr:MULTISPECIES: hypothetical protein [Methylomonas]AMK78042.1 hypothetical protein JT25_016410 [Methylomonas denitrificans]OAI07660.1 hypothetical protein A1342_10230 [Methylomonas methanica]TCV85577.1 hypothetical protein EDE11_105139 [Methylomonas methanica]
MKILAQDFNVKLLNALVMSTFYFGFSQAAIAMDSEVAAAQVKAMICKNNMTVDQALEQSIKSNSQRDVGWRSFRENDYVDVERAILVSKATELHYRWRVTNDGNILAGSERAEKLCSSN